MWEAARNASPYTDGNDSSPYIRAEGHFVVSGSYANGIRGLGTGVITSYGLRLKTKASKLSVWCYSFGAKIMVSVDGVDRMTTYLPSASAYAETVVADGLDNYTIHEYVIKCVQGDLAFNSVQTYNDTLTTTLTVRPVWAFYGDSITAGSVQPLAGAAIGLATADEWISYCHTFAANNGRQDVNCGQFSTSVLDYTGHTVNGSSVVGNTVVTTRAMVNSARIAELPSNAEYVFVNAGFNDEAYMSTASPAMTVNGDFKPQFTTMLNNILAQCPTANYIIMGIWPSRGAGGTDAAHTSAVTASYNAAIQAAIAAANGGAGMPRCKYVPTDYLVRQHSVHDRRDASQL